MIINWVDTYTMKQIKQALGVNGDNISYIVLSDDLGKVKCIYSTSKFYSDKFVAVDVLSELKVLLEKELIRIVKSFKQKNLRCF
jgi:autonomous glycyl radical cofactor GrcA